MAIEKQMKAELFLFGATIAWGGSFTVIKLGLLNVTPLLFLCTRFALSFILFLPFIFKRIRQIDRKTLLHGLILGFFMYIGYGGQMVGLAYTTVAKSSLFTYMFALLVPPLQYFILRKKLHIGNLIGLGIVMAGIVCFTSPKASSLNFGDYISFGAAAGYAVYIVLLDRFNTGGDSMLLTGIQMFTVSVLAGGTSLFLETPTMTFSGNLGFSLFYLAVFSGIFTVLIMNKFQKETTPTKAVIIYAMEPVFSVITAFLILGETLKTFELFGGFVIILGVIISEIWVIIPRKKKYSGTPREGRDDR